MTGPVIGAVSARRDRGYAVLNNKRMVTVELTYAQVELLISLCEDMSRMMREAGIGDRQMTAIIDGAGVRLGDALRRG